MPIDELKFRPLRPQDFPLLERWLSRPHIDAWWREPLDLASVHARYAPRIDGTEPTHVFIIEHGERPIGWIQWYRWTDYREHAAALAADLTTAGIDLAIGEPEMLSRGLGPRALRAFLDAVVFVHPEITACVCDPEVANARSVRAFEKAGFIVVRTVQLPRESSPRRVVQLPRHAR